MPRLLLQNGSAARLATDAEDVVLDAPLGLYANLPDVLRRLTRLKRLRIKIHFARHSSLWPYGELDPYNNLEFLRDLNTLEELELYFLHRLTDGSAITELPKLRKVSIRYKTRFDLSWLNVSQIEALSLGLTQMVSHHEIITEMFNMRELEMSNVLSANLHWMRPLRNVGKLWLSGRVKSLEGIGGADNMRMLHLGLRFGDYGDFKQLRQLEELHLQSTYDFTSLEQMNTRQLRTLTIYGSKSKIQDLDSIKPLSRAMELEKFVFGGIIRDGNITPLLALPKLRDCMINPRYKDAIGGRLGDAARLGIFRF